MTPFLCVAHAVEWAKDHLTGPCVVLTEDRGWIRLRRVGTLDGWYWGWERA